MGRYRLIVLAFMGILAVCALALLVWSNDPVGFLTLLAGIAAATLTILFFVVSAQRKLERAIRGGTIGSGGRSSGADREYQRELRIAEVVTRDMPEAHAEQLVRVFHARADRIEELLREPKNINPT